MVEEDEQGTEIRYIYDAFSAQEMVCLDVKNT
jgi:hypothetical protein